MSIYRLGSDAWENILRYLDTSGTIPLLLSGDNTLRTILKSAIREFSFCFETTTSPRLSSLLSIFKCSSISPSRFHISLGTYYALLQFVSEDYEAEKWKTFFPETLESLELALDCCNLPFTSLLTSLPTLAPQLKKLCIAVPPEKLRLPQSLIFLELGSSDTWLASSEVIMDSNFIESLPTTLAHLKLHPNVSLESDIDASKIPFKKMALTVFHGNMTFSSLTKQQACWSILPSTITDLGASLYYGEEAKTFENPSAQSWKQLFPNLTSIKVPIISLHEKTEINYFDTMPEEMVSEEKLFSIRNLFPSTLTALDTTQSDTTVIDSSLPLLIAALGQQLKFFQFFGPRLNASKLKWLPKWEDPKIELFDTVFNYITSRPNIIGGDNMENYFSNENSTIHRLCRNATSLKCGMLPSSAISFLPRNIKSIKCQVAEQDPLCLETAFKASKRQSSSDKSITIDDFKNNNILPWSHLRWPPRLTSLTLAIIYKIPFHLGCLPPTLKELQLGIYDTTDIEGGDLAHLKELSTLSFKGRFMPSINSLNVLPRSLKSFTAFVSSVSCYPFDNPDLIFFSNLKVLSLSLFRYSANILLYLPVNITAVMLITSSDGPCFSEKQFEQISRTKLAHLEIKGDAIWPHDLHLDVFSRFMPKSLATLILDIADWKKNENLAKDLAPHIPVSLLKFNSRNSVLNTLVKDRITQYKSSHGSSR